MKEKKILFGVLVAFVFLLSTGLTYAYFSVTESVEGEANEIVTSTGTLELLYNGGPTILSEEIYPGWTSSKTFTVTNTGSLDIYYSIDWEELVNEISRSELVMSLMCTGVDCARLNQEPVGNVGGPIIEGISISPGVTHTYELTLTFIETGSEQNYNQGKKFSGRITISESYGFFDMYGTLVNASNAPIAGATVTLRSEPRTAVTDENGNFMFENVEMDNHTISVTSSGEEILNDSIIIKDGNRTEIVSTTLTKRKRTKQVNIKIKVGSDKSITSIEPIRYTLSSDWATLLGIDKANVMVIAVETELESPSTYTFYEKIYNKNKNGIDVSQDGDGSVLASTYTDGTNDMVVMINSRGMTSLPSDSSGLFSDGRYDCDNINTWYSGFYRLVYLQAENFDTSQVTNMNAMFCKAGYANKMLNTETSNWETTQEIESTRSELLQELKEEYEEYYGMEETPEISWVTPEISFGTYINPTFVLDVSSWDTSQVTDMGAMFKQAGYSSPSIDINLSAWDTSLVTNMDNMFDNFGHDATIWSIGDLSTWNTSKVTNMSRMFYMVGSNSTTVNLDLKAWDISKVENMYRMFYGVGKDDTTFTLNIKNFNLSEDNVVLVSFNGMFYDVSSNAHITVGSVESRDWILNLRYGYRPSSWNTLNFTIDETI